MKSTDNAKCWQGCGTTGTLTLVGNAKCYSYYENVPATSYKVKFTFTI